MPKVSLESIIKKVDPIEPVTPDVPKQELKEEQESDSVLSDVLRDIEQTPTPVNIENTQGLDGEREGKVYELHKKSGFDIPTVRDFLSEVESTVNSIHFTTRRDKKNVGAYIEGSLVRGQPNSAISGDDAEGLNRVESKWQRLKRGASTGFETGDIETKINILTARRELMGFDPVVVNKQITELEEKAGDIEPFEPTHLLEKIVTSTARQLPQQIAGLKQGFKRAPLGALIAGTAATIVGQIPPFTAFPEEAVVVPTVAGGAVTGFIAGRTEQMFYQEFGGAYREYLGIRDTAGNPISPGLAKTMAIGAGGVNAILENAAFLKMVKAYPGGDKLLEKMTPNLIRKVAKSKTVRAQLASIAARFGIAWTAEETTEILQETSTVVMGELAKVIQAETTGAEFDEFDWGAFRERLTVIAEETAYSTVGFLFPGSALSTGKVLADSQISKRFHADTDELMAVVHQSKTQERSQDHMREALHKIKEADEDVYVSNEFWDGYFQETREERLDQEEILKERQELLDHLGVSHTQVSESMTTGEDITVKANSILTLRPAHYDAIKDDIKPAPGAYTRRELNDQKDVDDLDHTVELIKDVAIEKKATAEGINKEIKRLSNEIKKVKLPDDQLKIETPILLRGIVERAALEGIDPVQKLKNISIKRTPFAEFVERTKGFFQAVTPEAEQLSLQIAQLETRIAKVDPTTNGGRALISRLEQEKVQAEEKLAETGTIGFTTFFQAAPKKGKPRGHLAIQGERRLIEVFEGGDLSTILHEVGHIALLEYTAIEQSGEASDALRADMKTVREWVGAEEGAELTVKQSEQVARGWEAWLREGKAPTTKLTAVFERLMNFLKSVYKTAKSLNVTLNDDIRGVFDRMVSQGNQVEVAAANTFTIKTTKEMGDLGVSEPDKIFAKELINDALVVAKKRYHKARNANWEPLNKKWKEEARREIRQEIPAYVTIDEMIKAGDQMNREDFLNAGQAEISDLPTARLVKKDGKNIDMLAALYFDTDATTMIDNLVKLPKFSEAVNERVVQKQREHDARYQVEDFVVDLPEYRKYLELMARYVTDKGLDDATIDEGIQRNVNRWEKEAAQEIRVESPELTGKEFDREVSLRVQEKIDNFRSKKARVGAISTDALKELARQTMEAKTVKGARRVDKFLSTAKKEAGKGRRAIIRKDWTAASKASELERFNYEMASLSTKIRDEVDTILDRAKRIGKEKTKETIEFEHKEAILNLVDKFNLAPFVQRNPEVAPNFGELFAGDVYGKSFEAPAFFNGKDVDYRNLRVEQLRELDSAIRYLEGEGRIGKNEFMADGETSFKKVNNESVGILDTMKVLKKWEKGSMMRNITDWTRSAFARLDSLTFIAKSGDGYTNLGRDGVKGPLELYVIDPIKKAISSLISDEKRIKAEIQPHLDQIKKTNRKWRKQFKGPIQIEGVPLPAAMIANKQTKGWRDYQIWSIALNTGNTGERSNTQNLLAGYPDITPAMVEKIKGMLTIEDMEAVQGIWDTINSLFPQADAQFLKDNNYHMPKVEATPFNFKGRDFRGGYYPIKHDRNLSFKVADRGQAEDFFNNEGAKITMPYTKKGFSVKRAGNVALPLKLELNVIDSHFRDVLQYIHFSDPIRDADRIIRNDKQRAALIKVLGEDVYNTMRPSLQHIASPKREGLDQPGARGWEILRGLSTAYILAWNTGVALKQPLSTFGAIRDLGGGNVAKGTQVYIRGIMEVLSSPIAHHQMMIDLSNYMNDRQKSFDRELKSEFIKLSAEQRGIYFGDKKVTWQDVRNFGFWQIRVADSTTVLPIWHGAYQDKLLPDQSNLLEAVSYADDIVRNSQPSAQPLDLSSWQRDGGAIRLFSQFQTFTVGKYGQRQRMFYRAWRQGKISTVDYAWFNFFDAFVPLTAINLLQAVLWGRDLEDEDTQIEMLIDIMTGWLTMGIPIVGSIARTYTSGYGEYLDSPVLQTGNKMIKGLFSGIESLNGFENRKDRERALWNIAHAISAATGVPVAKIVAKAQKGAKQKKGAPLIKYLVPAPKGK